MLSAADNNPRGGMHMDNQPSPVIPGQPEQPQDPKTRAENRWENEGGGVDPVKEPEPDELPPEHPIDH